MTSKGLEALNILWESKQECSTSCNDMCLKCQKAKARETIEKELKVFEFMKDKMYNINANDFRHEETPKEEHYWAFGYEVSKEEYDLLKEVLL